MQSGAILTGLCVYSTLWFTGCSGQQGTAGEGGKQEAGKQSEVYKWTKLLDSAAWHKSYNFQMFSFRDTLWTFHPDGTWLSVNGKDWQKSPLPNALNNLAFLDYVVFKDAVYAPGHFEGNIEHFTFTTPVSKTTDGRHWMKLADSSALPRRFFAHPFVFRDQLWLIGGDDEKGTYADVWNSTDALHWTKQRDKLPFGKRGGSQVVELNGELYLLNNDVWRSKNGLDWEQVTPEIVKGEEIFGYAALVFDQKIWLMGCNRNGQFSSQVLYSADGINWERQEAPWLPRGGIAAAVYQNRIYMTGGKYGGTPDHPEFRYDNDVWVMEKRK